MTHAFLIRVGETWITTRKRRRSTARYLLPTPSRDKAFRFTKDDAERIAADLQKRESLFERANVRPAETVEILPTDD